MRSRTSWGVFLSAGDGILEDESFQPSGLVWENDPAFKESKMAAMLGADKHCIGVELCEGEKGGNSYIYSGTLLIQTQ